MAKETKDCSELVRLDEARTAKANWKKWGPYLSERQWGTVREDYSKDGNAWDYFSHDQARSRAYRWGEDGLAGFCDDQQLLCFSLALWNGQDPILKERLFGLTNSEGNHGEDVKEYYFYLDSTPTHSYMKYLYKYPQKAYPYDNLVSTNKQRGRKDLEYELLDTGVFNEDRYWDVFVEFAKETADDVLIQITACNRGPEAASLHILPTLLFRNTWSWGDASHKPSMQPVASRKGSSAIAASHDVVGQRYLYCDGDVPLLFTENETNSQRIFGKPNPSPYVKDAIHNYLIHGQQNAINPERKGTKVTAHHKVTVPGGGQATVRLRLSDVAPEKIGDPFKSFAKTFDTRKREADDFYGVVTPETLNEDQARVMRQALAGMLWTKQYFGLNVDQWLEEHGIDPLNNSDASVRNREWYHMVNEHVISMPDKWEYPWYAAWDLAFHSIALSTVDIDFAKEQLDLMLQEFFLHPTGQIPAYEWNFSDVNPPVHAWATMFLYRMESALRGQGDTEFLKRSFSKLMLNFSWWVNRKDRFGRNVFEGGFLGLDNIGVFDRSAPLPTGGYLEQADGTAWMTLFGQNMAEIAIELAAYDPFYEEMAVKFADHLLWIAHAMNRTGPDGMWDEEDGFYYDVLRLPDGTAHRLKVRSMVGLLPMCAVTVIEPWQRERVPRAVQLLHERMERMPELRKSMHPTGINRRGKGDRGIAALVNPERLRRILTRMLDEEEFLSPHGIRSLSRYHEKHPYSVKVEGKEYRIGYLPAESDSGMFGGNSNWRGPIWMPVNVVIIRALLTYYLYYGDDFKIECPTGSGNMMNLYQVGHEVADRLSSIFLRDKSGRRPVYGGTEKFQTDPHWKDNLLFYEYFHGDNGAGLGASHQTGWTGLVAKLLEIFGLIDEKDFLEVGKRDAAAILGDLARKK